MTITLTGLSKNQWRKTVVVLLWVLLSIGLSFIVVWITKNYKWLATAPAFNVVVFALTQVFQQEETSSENQLSPAAQAQVAPVLSALDSLSPPSNPPTSATQG